LRVYNARGQLVRTLVDESRDAGPHGAQWNGRDHDNQPVAGGAYFYVLEAEGQRLTGKMSLVK
jgi:flagellar hook assembly protein FlgD